MQAHLIVLEFSQAMETEIYIFKISPLIRRGGAHFLMSKVDYLINDLFIKKINEEEQKLFIVFILHTLRFNVTWDRK